MCFNFDCILIDGLIYHQTVGIVVIFTISIVLPASNFIKFLVKALKSDGELKAGIFIGLLCAGR